MKKNKFLLLALAVLAAQFAVTTPLAAAPKPLKIGVFIPGVSEGSPNYENLIKGAQRFAKDNPDTEVKVFEAGYNQAEWQEKLTSFVATGNYDYVITSNPSLPDLINVTSKLFPKQKFICLDGSFTGNPNLYTVLYNQVEQGYITGYLAGMLSTSKMPGTNADKKVGMIIGQHYPAMDKLIIPGFEKGLKAVDPAFQIDVRVLGNWFDATKAAELARSMIEAGADVILPICGSGSQGAIKVAQEAGIYLVFFDNDEYARAPGTILGCTILKQEELAYNCLKQAAQGTLPFGKADVVGIKEGYVEFLDTNPNYLAKVPVAIRNRLATAIRDIKSGKIMLPVPQL